jgi:hypothetical protein
MHCRLLVFALAIALLGWACGRGAKAPGAEQKEKGAAKETATKKKSEKPEARAKVKEEVRELAEKMIMHEIQNFSVQIQTPESWQRKDLNEKAISFRGKRIRLPSGTLFMPRADVYEFPGVPASLEEAAGPCLKDDEATNKVTETLDSGAYFYSCEKKLAGQTLVQFKTVMPITKTQALQCGGSVPVGMTIPMDICKSLARLPAGVAQ